MGWVLLLFGLPFGIFMIRRERQQRRMKAFQQLFADASPSQKAESERKDSERSKRYEVIREVEKERLDALYVEYSAKSKHMDSKANKAHWIEYDDEQEKIRKSANEQCLVEYGSNFFEDLDSDADAVGWRWELGEKDKDHQACMESSGNHTKGEGPNFPGHSACTCHLSMIFKGERVKMHKAQEGSP